jgi:hypothetical protein
MTGLEICQWVRDTPLSGALSGSTWGQPAIGALHVLGIAWFGGAAIHPHPRLAAFRWTGLALMLSTGVLLFWGQPVHCYQSLSFRIKMLLLLFLCVPHRRYAAWALWAAAIAASRGIAFF